MAGSRGRRVTARRGARATPRPGGPAANGSAAAPREVRLHINGREYAARCEPRKTLADFIREDCGLTGTHLGCEHGVCGACTILVDGEAVRSCLLFAVQAHGARLLTVEGLARGDRLHPIQQAYWEHHGLQCGFCTPGFLMTTLAFLQDNPRPTEREIREGLSGNLCRCTGYQNIVKAVAAAAETLASGADPEFFPALAQPRGGTKAVLPTRQGERAPEAKKSGRAGGRSHPRTTRPRGSPRRTRRDT